MKSLRAVILGLTGPVVLGATLAAVVVLAMPVFARADVFAGDPIDAGTGLPHPMMPGLPLVLDGDDDRWNTGDDTVDPGFTGDIDLAVRVGTVTAVSIPAPSGAAGGPSITVLQAGGGSSGSFAEAGFTVLVSDGAANPPYGNVIDDSGLDNRGLVVFAFGDLDGDGIIGPTNTDGSTDNSVELQEANAYLGRQVGVLAGGRGHGTLGIQIAAPASIGGLAVSLSAGAYTGNDSQILFIDGTPIFTKWPFFPPLDPNRVVGNGGAPPPDPELTSKIKFEPENNFAPDPATPGLLEAFAVATDGSEPTTDQLIVVSGPAASVRLFSEIDAASFRASARVRIRPAPSSDGASRVLVIPVSYVVIPVDGTSTTHPLRLLPVDILGNVADTDVQGLSVELRAHGAVRIVSPNADGDQTTETLALIGAVGTSVVLNDTGLSGEGRVDVLLNGKVVWQTLVVAGSALDEDGDGVFDDGNGSGIVGDRPCTTPDGGAGCDDNCLGMINPSQVDDGGVGFGACCNGDCIEDPLAEGCGECQLPAGGGPGSVPPLDRVNLRVRMSAGQTVDRMTLKVDFDLPPGVEIHADTESVTLGVFQNDTLLYSGLLDGVMQNVSTPTKTRFKYKDKSASLDSISRASLRQRKGVSYRFRLRARAPGLIDVGVGAVRLDLQFGGDLLRSIFDCVEKGNNAVRCVLSN